MTEKTGKVRPGTGLQISFLKPYSGLTAYRGTGMTKKTGKVRPGTGSGTGSTTTADGVFAADKGHLV